MSLITYVPSLQTDMILSKIYTDILYAGDGAKLLLPHAQTLSGFLQLCQPPNVCILGFDRGEYADINGPWLFANFEPCFNAAFLALWIKPIKRGTRQSLRYTFDLLEGALETCPLIMGVTKQEHLIEEHEKLGYKLGCKLPKLWGGEDCWLLTIDQAGLATGKARFAALWKTQEPEISPFELSTIPENKNATPSGETLQ